MATFSQTIEVGGSDHSAFDSVHALVDTGATYTWIPREIVNRLGIQPAFTRRLRLPDGTVIERDAAQVLVKIEGQVLLTVCIFGDEGTHPLLGPVTLQQFGLGVDPLTRVPVFGQNVSC